MSYKYTLTDNCEPQLEFIKVSNSQPFYLPSADLSASATVKISNMEMQFEIEWSWISALCQTRHSSKCSLEISPWRLSVSRHSHMKPLVLSYPTITTERLQLHDTSTCTY